MSTFGSNSDLHNKIGQAVNKLNTGELSVNDLDELVGDARELYERLLILRYKAFENRVHESESVSVPSVEQKIEPKKDDLVIPDEPPSIEFALFGEMPDREIEQNEKPQIIEEKVDEVKSHQEHIVQGADDRLDKSNSIQENQNTSGASLMDRLANSSSSMSRLGDQLKHSRIDSILGALTLNDKIRFTKNLFDGNNDTFNAACQLLDAQKSMDAANELLAQYSLRYEWDKESKNTIDFREFVERRYA